MKCPLITIRELTKEILVMTEQLDLFFQSAIQEEQKVREQDLQEKHDRKYKPTLLTPRQWRLLCMIEYASLQEHRKLTQKEICDTIESYEWNDDEKCHDHCVAIWNDIKDINLSYQTDKVIISKNFEYWIGDESETKSFIDKLWNDLEPRLMRYWAYLKKVERNGQGQLLSRKLDPIGDTSKAREWIESYGKERIGD